MSELLSVEGKQSNSIDPETHYKLVEKSQEVYNNLTFQIIKLLKLLINVGKYNIKVVKEEQG